MRANVSFSYLQAIGRLDSGPVSAFAAGLSSAQKLQRLNEVADRFYEFGTWRGLFEVAPNLTTVAGILTLSSAYLKLEALNYGTAGCKGANIPVKTMQWAFSPSGEGYQDFSLWCRTYALDMGDVGGVRKYNLTGNTTTLDSNTYTGLVRRRYTWVSETATIFIPDSYQALKLGVQALGWEDMADTDRYQKVFAQALQVLEGNLTESTADQSWGSVQIDSAISIGANVPVLL